MSIPDWVACGLVMFALAIMIAICAGWTSGMRFVDAVHICVDRLVKLVARKRI